MALLDTITDAVHRFTPQKRDKIPAAGIGNGVYNHEEDRILSRFTLSLHALQIFFMFLVMCCFASVASFQAHWIGSPSSLSGFVIFISIFSMFLSAFFIAIPFAYEKYDKMARLARAFREVRVQFIMTGSGAAITPIVAMIATISSWTQAGCKDPNNDPRAKKLGDEFKDALGGWCRTKKAGSIFLWFAAAAYIASFVYVFFNWRRGKGTYDGNPMDPPFSHPEEPSHEMEDAVEDPYTRPRVSDLPPRLDATSPFDDSNRYSGYSAPTRQSMDPYGAFNDDAPSGYDNGEAPGVSRTMQYADPYAAARGRVAQGSPQGGPQSGPPGYDNYGGGGGYR
ncbi:hypothetical protein BKA62DRAFT_687206 [Auriculariales sp. MPI-PUGE-AT-0066]|nr:hypothetical protein BKA62DRAFT_687206 [Auriculariales sp. MPI-PUGE-AT-0066]